MNTQLSYFSRATRTLGALAVLIALNLASSFAAAVTLATNAPSAATTNALVTSAASASPKVTDSDDDDDGSGGKHTFKLDLKTDRDPTDRSLVGEIGDEIIPLTAIVLTFATPILIVFFVVYFKYRRRQETLALAREFLSKGMPVPPELLDPSQSVNLSVSRGGSGGASCDLRRGFRLTFIGLALAVAFYVTSPHSTMWGWGLIPMIMGIGFLISGWVGSRSDSGVENRSNNPPPDSRKIF